MKKLITLSLVLTLAIMSMGCGSKKEETSSVDVREAIEILNTVWGTYGEDEKFAIVGGDYDNMVDGAPGVLDLSVPENADTLAAIPVDTAAKLDDCAAFMHMMNANTFTVSASHVKDSGEVDNVVNEIKAGLETRQWMCGFPEKMLIATVGDYVVTSFGAGDLMETFKGKLIESYPAAEVVVDASLDV